MTKITIQNATKQDILEFLNTDDMPNLGDEINLPCDIKIVSASSKSQKFIENSVFHFFIQSLSSVGIGILSAYLYDKICKGVEKSKLKVNDNDVKKDEVSIRAKLSVEMNVELTLEIDNDTNS